MGAFNLRRFSSPGSLRTVHPRHLLAFLKPFREFLARRGLELLAEPTADEIDYDALVAILMDPGPDTPPELIDALYCVHEMATDEGMDALLEAAVAHSLPLEPRADQTPADVAMQMWVLDAELVQQKHAEQFLAHPRSFEYYQCKVAKPPKFKLPRAEVLCALEHDVDNWFEQKRRGRGARIFPFPKDDGVWFLIRHGSPYRREGSIRDGEPSSVHYRPLKFDVLVYDPRIGEIRVNAASKGEKSVYREKFGKHLFGDPDFFPGTNKYDLEPLRRDGKASLVCVDVAGMEWARLKEVQYYWGGAYGEIEGRRASDVLAAYEARDRSLPERPRMIRAAFEIRFENCRRSRTVVVRPPNVAQYTRDGDSTIIENWLTKRGFIVSQEYAADAEPRAAVAGA